MLRIRPLTAQADSPLVDAFWPTVADYIRMERGEEPAPQLTPILTEDFFTSAPPGADPAAGVRLGLFQGDALAGIAEISFGFPAAGDAFLGLMLLDARARGRGHGRAFLAAAEEIARARAAPRLYLAVLDANPRGRAFWEREGFTLHEAGRSVTLGTKTQTACRLVKPLA